ncbi:2Fe-2S iron-sulfur cluster binding domain-containing protein [Paraburkholderia sp. 1N]|uniref:2Fe-2S iron-sulfur cluster binding domain-containing protein n=1 Tax=Paraburkholderia solitsugae TaxID=2675748 RepID=A0ABX2BNG3_9BURK|nr:benzoate 1,2-dioxygenase electron transfer component BenC [Paraburkholderia solitsugae]NPT42457.1 2Fe-2S iron-sulfur cluster binding domain-containing protein [Paraburkholderia solitsugae]
MSFNIALNFEDGVTRFVNCGSTESVVDAAYRQGINIPMDCREGACATCKCRVESGSYSLGDYIEDALSSSEADQGYALACQMRPTADCVVLVPTSSTACNTRQESYVTQIKEVSRLSDSTFSLVLQGDGLKDLVFLPGQYANLQVPGEEQRQRAYSFSAMTARSDSVTFLIRNVPGGLMSNFLKERAKPGGELIMHGPFGSFYLRPLVRPLLMLAGGTGLAPFLAMLDKIVAAGSSPFPIHLIYGVNTDRDVVEIDKLEAFTRAIPNFTFEVCVVDANSERPKKGYVTHHIEPAHLNDGDVDIYLCGPPPMVEAVAQYLRDVDVKSASFHFEKFAASIS